MASHWTTISLSKQKTLNQIGCWSKVQQPNPRPDELLASRLVNCHVDLILSASLGAGESISQKSQHFISGAMEATVTAAIESLDTNGSPSFLLS